MKIILNSNASAKLALMILILQRDVEIVEPVNTISLRPSLTSINLSGWELKAPHERTYGPPKHRKKGKTARW